MGIQRETGTLDNHLAVIYEIKHHLTVITQQSSLVILPSEKNLYSYKNMYMNVFRDIHQHPKLQTSHLSVGKCINYDTFIQLNTH